MSNSTSLGRMQQVDLRKVWLSESGYFTPWLAQDDNISLLADTLGMDLELEAQEKGVGPYRADIVCKDTTDGTLVLIENQLEKTDHTHLGQLMTYAAGLDAVTIVWIAERFTDEHRAALDWLNEITGENISCFGLEIELWRIGNSPIAPKFNVVCKPNDWIKGKSSGGGGGVVTETKQLQQVYWQALREVLAEQKSSLKPQKAHPQHWLNVSIGRSNFNMAATINTLEERIAVEVYMQGADAKRHFKQLEADKAKIEKEIGHTLDWRELPEKETSRILLMRPNSSIKDSKTWPEQHKWLAETLERFNATFRPRIQSLPTAYGDDEVEAG
ncbi:MAG: DUF4268 domain-containing protein [Verrucomicrobia bacterium]|nr:DUF4268 domain-containing protein [Verrucomicrobiota bacterium]